MLHVVTGPPCAGKTTFINEHKSDGDIVVDLDALAVSLGASDTHEYNESIYKAALAARSAAISSIGESNAWVIHTQPTEQQREEYRGAIFHDLNPGIDECIKRAKNDGRPNWTIDAINKWYRKSESTDSFFIGQTETGRQISDGTEKVPFLCPKRARKGSVMADEMQAQSDETPVEQVDESTDWQAKYEAMREHMRDWEKKAKANQSAADELEQLKAAQMSEQEKAIARAEAAEKELNALKAEKAKNDMARNLSKETGAPFEMLILAKDDESMADLAKMYSEQSHVSSAPKATNGSRIIKGGETKPSNREIFAQFAAENLKF